MKLIVAYSNNGVIGGDGKLLWHVPEDLRNFKQTTAGHVVVMGRKTYESLPDGALPFRKNIVLTRDENYTLDDAEVMHSIEEVLTFEKENPTETIFIIGGAEIYKAFMPYIEEMHITFVDVEIEGDAHFSLDRSVWAPIHEPQLQVSKTGIPYSISILRKIKEAI